MAGSLNKVILIGNLGKDPESKTFQSGDKVVSFSIATSESWKDKATGEFKDKTEWHNIVIFNENLCKLAEQYLKKGVKVYIEGSIQQRSYQDRSTGEKKYSTEIVLQKYRGELKILSPVEKNNTAADQGNNAPAASYGDLDDEIPF